MHEVDRILLILVINHELRNGKSRLQNNVISIFIIICIHV